MIRVMLLREARVKHQAGEIVTVSPEVAQFLVSVGSGLIVAEEKKQTKKAKK